MDKLFPSDITFLREIARIVGECHERMNFTKRDLTGASLYAANLTEGQLEAAHVSLKRYINDRDPAIKTPIN